MVSRPTPCRAPQEHVTIELLRFRPRVVSRVGRRAHVDGTGVAVGPPPLTPVVQCRVDFKSYEVLPSLDDVIADALEELAEGDGLSATITSRVSVGISSGVVG
ncbi:hypothetical protein GW17_00025583 [Ensete ventricosum]|nr:hypothetical protein GW17_00025583 [Ensete ventricosum]